MKSHKTSLEELPCAHPAPPVIIGITGHEAAEDKEEVDSEIAVIDYLGCIVRPSVGFHHMEAYNYQSSHAAQSVKDFEAWL